MPRKLGLEKVESLLEKTVRFTFSIEEGKLRRFNEWCQKNKVSAALVLRMYFEKVLAESKK